MLGQIGQATAVALSARHILSAQPFQRGSQPQHAGDIWRTGLKAVRRFLRRKALE
ncbi:hypothetical protein D3C79_983050 [compost metagenome]